MHSVDYAVVRCLPVRPSVCPSHAGILLNISSNVFHFHVAIMHIPVSRHQTVWQYYAPPPYNGGVECKGCDKIAIFDLALSRK